MLVYLNPCTNVSAYQDVLKLFSNQLKVTGNIFYVTYLIKHNFIKQIIQSGKCLFFFKTLIFVIHLKLEIVLAIPASTESKNLEP